MSARVRAKSRAWTIARTRTRARSTTQVRAIARAATMAADGSWVGTSFTIRALFRIKSRFLEFF